MAVNDVYLLSLRSVLNGEQCVNTLAFRLLTSTAPSVSSLGTLAQALKDGLRTQQVDDLVYTDWTALEVNGAGATYATTAPFRTTTVAFAGGFTGTLTGSLTGTPITNQEAQVIAINTAQAGRRRKGRFFLAGVSEAAVSDASVISTAQLALVATMISTTLAPYFVGGTDTTHRLGVWSNRIATNTSLDTSWPRQMVTRGAPSPTTAFADAVSATARQYVGSQRNRRPGI